MPNQGMIDILIELREVIQQNVPFTSMFPIILMQMLLHSVNSECVAFVLHAGSIVIDKSFTQNWNKGIICKASLDNALTDRHALDMSRFGSLVGIPFMRLDTLILELHQLLVSALHPDWSSKDVPLDGAFPGNILPAVSIGFP